MTTQENIAKHLGVNFNEPFTMNELPHTVLHIDPNLGVVTQDGDRLSSVMLQTLLFSGEPIIKLDKRRYYIAHRVPVFDKNFILPDLAKYAEALEKIPCNDSYDKHITEVADIIAKKYCNDIQHIHEFERVFNECSADTERMQDCCRLDEYFEACLAYNVEEELSANLNIIVFNMLASYIGNIGVEGVKTVEELTIIISSIAENADWSETPQEQINYLIKEVTNNA